VFLVICAVLVCAMAARLSRRPLSDLFRYFCDRLDTFVSTRRDGTNRLLGVGCELAEYHFGFDSARRGLGDHSRHALSLDKNPSKGSSRANS
jgi:hypothetical protein